jgi:hypothetical protein
MINTRYAGVIPVPQANMTLVNAGGLVKVCTILMNSNLLTLIRGEM